MIPVFPSYSRFSKSNSRFPKIIHVFPKLFPFSQSYCRFSKRYSRFFKAMSQTRTYTHMHTLQARKSKGKARFTDASKKAKVSCSSMQLASVLYLHDFDWVRKYTYTLAFIAALFGYESHTILPTYQRNKSTPLHSHPGPLTSRKQQARYGHRCGHDHVHEMPEDVASQSVCQSAAKKAQKGQSMLVSWLLAWKGGGWSICPTWRFATQ